MKSPYDITKKLDTEHKLRESGYRYICGVDEVGRGPLAGPVVCAAVVMPLDDDMLIMGVDDSKKLSEKRREALEKLIKERAVEYRIQEISPADIDRLNILQATRLAMKMAIESLPYTPDYVITDGNMTLDIAIPQHFIIKGDSKSYTIGAASILAKTYRDRLMDEYAELYPIYNWKSNKGYPTKDHIEAIKQYGICPIHRKSFVTKWTAKDEDKD